LHFGGKPVPHVVEAVGDPEVEKDDADALSRRNLMPALRKAVAE